MNELIWIDDITTFEIIFQSVNLKLAQLYMHSLNNDDLSEDIRQLLEDEMHS